MDCLLGLPKLKPRSVDLFLTDPEFAIGFKSKKANYNRKAKLVIKGYTDTPIKTYQEFTDEWIGYAKEALKDGGAMYVITGDQNLRHVLNALAFHGFKYQQIIWAYQFATYAKISWIIGHYNIIYAWKKKYKPKLNTSCRFQTTKQQYHDMQSVWYIKREYWTGRKKTATKLPSELIAKILDYSSKPGDIVCDPFLGSGQVAKVAKEMKRQYIGFEKVKNHYDFAVEHIASAKPLPPTLKIALEFTRQNKKDLAKLKKTIDELKTKPIVAIPGPDPSVADKCPRCGKTKPNKHRNFCSKRCEKLWGKPAKFTVVFYKGDKTVLTEHYDNKPQAKKRMKEYKGGYSVRLEIKP